MEKSNLPKHLRQREVDPHRELTSTEIWFREKLSKTLFYGYVFLAIKIGWLTNNTQNFDWFSPDGNPLPTSTFANAWALFILTVVFLFFWVYVLRHFYKNCPHDHATVLDAHMIKIAMALAVILDLAFVFLINLT